MLNHSDLERLYKEIDAVASALTLNYCKKLYELARESQGSILEIGTSIGKSMFFLALGAKELGKKVIGVDSYAVGRCTSELLHVNFSYMLDLLSRYGLRETVVPIISTSAAAKGVIESIEWGLVHIDGDHSEVGVTTDIQLVENNVKKGGKIIFHDSGSHEDFQTGHPEVESAISKFLASTSKYVETDPVKPEPPIYCADSDKFSQTILVRL